MMIASGASRAGCVRPSVNVGGGLGSSGYRAGPRGRPQRAGGLAAATAATDRAIFPAILVVVVAAAAALAMSASLFEVAEARYIHSTYRFSPGELGDEPLATNGNGNLPQMSRRQDYESGDGDSDEDDDSGSDQRPAASHRNQDDSSADAGGGDNYGDNESDGPYDETPVEQEGQADLERFFDDHLGASDRDGMDKENLPTNLVSLLSEPPQSGNLSRTGHPHQPALPAFAISQQSQPLAALTVVPLAPVVNPIVQPVSRDNVAVHENFDPLSSLPTIQTSFIRLPDEKMIITHQVTARNSDRGSSPPRPLKFFTDDADYDDKRAPSSGGGGGGASDSAQASRDPGLGQMAALVGGWQLAPSLRISPTESLPNMPTGNLRPVSNDLSPATGASNNDVVATEDDDFDRVYVTNETSRPFKIDALGGFDPEEDFIDAAKELEVVASDETPTRAPAAGSTNRGLKRRSNQQQQQESRGGAGRDLAESAPSRRVDEQQQPGQPGQEISFNDPDTDMMYEDASETDEVTFGQDDPYQTDLEAEMRQQEYDRLTGRSGQQTNDQPNMSGSLNVVVDNGNTGANGAGVGREANDDEEDIDADMDHEYRTEPTGRQRESMAAAAAGTKSRAHGRAQNEIDDEGAWVNDGVDEMDIPSQSHQNSVLDKAEQRDEAAKKVADENAAANNKQDPDGSAESGQTNDNGEENVRMPNADYLKNDFVEDDSGYAA